MKRAAFNVAEQNIVFNTLRVIELEGKISSDWLDLVLFLSARNLCQPFRLR